MGKNSVDERSLQRRAGIINLTRLRTSSIKLQDGTSKLLSLVDEAGFRSWVYWLIGESRKTCKSNHAAATLTILFNDCETMDLDDEESRLYVLNELERTAAFQRTKIALFVESEAQSA